MPPCPACALLALVKAPPHLLPRPAVPQFVYKPRGGSAPPGMSRNAPGTTRSCPGHPQTPPQPPWSGLIFRAPRGPPQAGPQEGQKRPTAILIPPQTAPLCPSAPQNKQNRPLAPLDPLQAAPQSYPAPQEGQKRPPACLLTPHQKQSRHLAPFAPQQDIPSPLVCSVPPQTALPSSTPQQKHPIVSATPAVPKSKSRGWRGAWRRFTTSVLPPRLRAARDPRGLFVGYLAGPDGATNRNGWS